MGTGLSGVWRRKNSGWDDHALGTGQGVARRKNSGRDDHVLGTGLGVVRRRKNSGWDDLGDWPWWGLEEEELCLG